MRITTAALFLLLLAGCSGIKPWHPPNHREEGPKGGLFSGPEGAWTIGVGGKEPPPAALPAATTSEKRGNQ